MSRVKNKRASSLEGYKLGLKEPKPKSLLGGPIFSTALMKTKDYNLHRLPNWTNYLFCSCTPNDATACRYVREFYNTLDLD